jgi:hypothetical protein
MRVKDLTLGTTTVNIIYATVRALFEGDGLQQLLIFVCHSPCYLYTYLNYHRFGLTTHLYSLKAALKAGLQSIHPLLLECAVSTNNTT